jgi:hypothetical protein
MVEKKQYNKIPVVLEEREFNEFVLEHLTKGTRGPAKKISFYKLFNYILKLLHTGCQWSNIPIDLDLDGKPEIHYTNIYRMFKFWSDNGCFEKIFISTVARLFKAKLLDTSIIHGDGTTTSAKKGETI